MSAFLGPIHYWMYQKIEFGNELVKELSEMVVEKGYDKELPLRMKEKCGTLEEGSLEEIIDKSNIHGWLQGKIGVVESSLAFLVTSLVDKNPEAMEDIKETAYRCGQSRKMSGKQSVSEAYKYLDGLFLNGMPCDRVISFISQEEHSFVWQQETDIHAVYWEAYQGDVSHYYEIRERLASGILEDTGVVYTQSEDQKFSLADGE